MNLLLQEINFLIFVFIIFRLKTVELYMDPKNDSEENIKIELKRNNRLRNLYMAFCLLFNYFQTSGSRYIENGL